MLQARPAILSYRGLSAWFFLFFFFFNIPSSRVCFGTALQKEKKKVTVEADRYIHPNIATENLAGEGGQRILKK